MISFYTGEIRDSAPIAQNIPCLQLFLPSSNINKNQPRLTRPINLRQCRTEIIAGYRPIPDTAQYDMIISWIYSGRLPHSVTRRCRAGKHRCRRPFPVSSFIGPPLVRFPARVRKAAEFADKTERPYRPFGKGHRHSGQNLCISP